MTTKSNILNLIYNLNSKLFKDTDDQKLTNNNGITYEIQLLTKNKTVLQNYLKINGKQYGTVNDLRIIYSIVHFIEKGSVPTTEKIDDDDMFVDVDYKDLSELTLGIMEYTGTMTDFKNAYFLNLPVISSPTTATQTITTTDILYIPGQNQMKYNTLNIGSKKDYDAFTIGQNIFFGSSPLRLKIRKSDFLSNKNGVIEELQVYVASFYTGIIIPNINTFYQVSFIDTYDANEIQNLKLIFPFFQQIINGMDKFLKKTITTYVDNYSNSLTYKRNFNTYISRKGQSVVMNLIDEFNIVLPLENEFIPMIYYLTYCEIIDKIKDNKMKNLAFELLDTTFLFNTMFRDDLNNPMFLNFRSAILKRDNWLFSYLPPIPNKLISFLINNNILTIDEINKMTGRGITPSVAQSVAGGLAPSVAPSMAVSQLTDTSSVMVSDSFQNAPNQIEQNINSYNQYVLTRIRNNQPIDFDTLQIVKDMYPFLVSEEYERLVSLHNKFVNSGLRNQKTPIDYKQLTIAVPVFQEISTQPKKSETVESSILKSGYNVVSKDKNENLLLFKPSEKSENQFVGKYTHPKLKGTFKVKYDGNNFVIKNSNYRTGYVKKPFDIYSFIYKLTIPKIERSKPFLPIISNDYY